MKSNKKRNYKYDLGSFVENNGAGIGQAGAFLGQAVGGGVGNVISSAASGAAIGTSLLPGIGTAVGAGLGILTGVLGNSAKKKAAKKAARAQTLQNNEDYSSMLSEQLDTVNDNGFGQDIVFKNGGIVPSNFINIEQGELQIDPATGKVLRKYDKVNPETGGMYKPHSKGKDSKDNFVSAEEGTFIITKEKSKDYLKAIENNDKLHQNTILQNIKNYKDDVSKSSKMADGSFVSGQLNTELLPRPNVFNYTSPLQMAPMKLGQSIISQQSQSQSSGFNLNNLLNYAPAIANIGQGLFGKVEQQANVSPIRNRYANQVINNMPEELSFEPIRNDLLRQQEASFNQIRNNTNGSSIARANMNNVRANTNSQLGRLRLDNGLANNQVKAQRGSIFNQLGAQDMQEQARAQQINLGINESNVANRAAKSNLLNTGLSQLQQTYQNNKSNTTKQGMDMYKVDLLKQMFPNLKYYGDQFGSDALLKLIGK